MEEFEQLAKADGNGGLIGGIGGLVGSILIFSGSYDKIGNIDSQIDNLKGQIKGIDSQLTDLSRQAPTIRYAAGRFISEEVHTRQHKIGVLTNERPKTPSTPLFCLEMAGGSIVAAALGVAVVNRVRYGLWHYRKRQTSEPNTSEPV
jgi:hypothetical protein